MKSLVENYTHNEFESFLIAEIMPSRAVAMPVILLFSSILILGLVGNTMVLFVVYRNRTMRTPTNVFLVNLAIADFFVLIFCLPPTIVWELTKTWWFGEMACKAMMFLQPTIVYVSVLTMVAIAFDRWHAICCLFKPKPSLESTFQVLAVIWIVSIICGAPEFVAVGTRPWDFSTIYADKDFKTKIGTTCDHGDHMNGGGAYNQIYWTFATLVMFFLPLTIVAVLYGKVAYVLWLKSMPPGHQLLTTAAAPNIQLFGSENSFGTRAQSVTTANRHFRHVLTRRKAAKMLILVVILFAVSYMPVVVMNMLRAWEISFVIIEHSVYVYASRWFMYLHSAIKPIIYMMSENFRLEFRRAFTCRRGAGSPHTEAFSVMSRRRQGQTPLALRTNANRGYGNLPKQYSVESAFCIPTTPSYEPSNLQRARSSASVATPIQNAEVSIVNSLQVPTGERLRLPSWSGYHFPTPDQCSEESQTRT